MRRSSRRQEVTLGQPRQRVQRLAGTQLRMRATVDELQILHDKLNVADRSLAQLDLAPVPPSLAQLLLGALLHAVNVRAHRGRIGAGIQQRLGPRQEFAGGLLAAGDGPRLEQRLLLPQARVLLQVGQIAIHGVDQRPDRPPGPQPHVDAVEKTGRGGLTQRLDQTLAQPRVTGCVGVGQHQQVDVGAVVKLLAAQFAHRDHDKPARIDRQFRGQQAETGLHHRVGQPGKL